MNGKVDGRVNGRVDGREREREREWEGGVLRRKWDGRCCASAAAAELARIVRTHLRRGQWRRWRWLRPRNRDVYRIQSTIFPRARPFRVVLRTPAPRQRQHTQRVAMYLRGLSACFFFFSCSPSNVLHVSDPFCLVHLGRTRSHSRRSQMFDKARSKPTTNVIGSSIGEIRYVCVCAPSLHQSWSILLGKSHQLFFSGLHVVRVVNLPDARENVEAIEDVTPTGARPHTALHARLQMNDPPVQDEQ